MFKEVKSYEDRFKNETLQKTLQRLTKARTSLVLEHPFIGTIALNMPHIMTEDVPTAATNGKAVYYNPNFCADKTDAQLKFLVAHECMHPMFEHNYRRGDRDPKKWNIAGDYVINQHLVEEKIGEFIEGGCLDQGIYDVGDGVTDKIYAILPDDGGGDGDGDGGIGQDLIDGEGSDADKARDAAEWRIKVAQAAQAAKMMGKLSAGLERLVDDMLNAKVNWQEVLRRFITKCKSDKRSFARPNRRFMSMGLYLPTSDGEQLGKMLFGVDCSGSIGQKELNEFAAEISAVHQDGRPSELHVVYFDSEVSHHETYTPDDTLDIKPHGGGGTAFSPIFKYAEEHGIDPVACVILTDLYCNDFGPAPEYPVLWVCNNEQNTEAPFGEVVTM